MTSLLFSALFCVTVISTGRASIQPACTRFVSLGNCRQERWVYNNVVGICQRTEGCPSSVNGNNFASEELCRQTCETRTMRGQQNSGRNLRSRVPECNNRAIGLGNCGQTRWVYSMRTGRCEQTVGCPSSRMFNNFDSQYDCNEACVNLSPASRRGEVMRRRNEQRGRVGRRNKKKNNRGDGEVVQLSICALPQAPGPCRAAIRQWFYNSESKKCAPFTYGGCGGNENRFRTAEACQEMCGSG